MRNQITWLIERERDIRKKHGLFMLCRRTISYILSPVFWRRTFIIHARQIRDEDYFDEDEFKPDIENWTFKNVSSHEEAERLEAEGFMFRYWPTFDNKKLKYYSKLLDVGATALCCFASRELAFIQWIIPSENAMRKVTYYRPKIDFSIGDRYVQGPWTNPNYRRKGLYAFNTYFNCDTFLRANGGKSVIAPVWDERVHVRRALESVGYRAYAKAKVTRLLWWKFWEGETSLSSNEKLKFDCRT